MVTKNRLSKSGKILNIVTNKHNFAFIYISFLILRSVYFLQKYVDVVCKACLIWGVIIICIDMFSSIKKTLKIYNSYLPLIMCIYFAICIIYNYKYSLYDGTKNLLYCLVYFFVLYSVKLETSKDDFYRYLKRNNDAFIILIFLITIASIVTFIFSIKFIYVVDNNLYRVGFWFNRLNGVLNTNMATIFGMISIVLCMINYYIDNKKIGRKKHLYIANFILQFIYYSLSGSRAATVCYLVVLFIFSTFIVYTHFRENNKTFKSLVISVIIFALIVSVGYGLKNGCQVVLKEVPPLITSISDSNKVESKEQDEHEHEHEIDFKRVEDFDNGDITNNRYGMWKAAFKIIKQNPIFGTAYADSFNADGTLKGNIDDSEFSKNEILILKSASFYFHNGYIQILLCGGIIFTVLFMYFAIVNLKKYLSHLFKTEKNTNDYKIFVLLFAIIAALVVDNLVEVHLLFDGQDGIASEFWYLLGTGIFLIENYEIDETKPIKEIKQIVK